MHLIHVKLILMIRDTRVTHHSTKTIVVLTFPTTRLPLSVTMNRTMRLSSKVTTSVHLSHCILVTMVPSTLVNTQPTSQKTIQVTSKRPTLTMSILVTSQYPTLVIILVQILQNNTLHNTLVKCRLKITPLRISKKPILATMPVSMKQISKVSSVVPLLQTLLTKTTFLITKLSLLAITCRYILHYTLQYMKIQTMRLPIPKIT